MAESSQPPEENTLPFSEGELKVINEAKAFVAELAKIGEQGSDNIMRELWAEIDGGGFGEGFLSKNDLQNRATAIRKIAKAKEAVAEYRGYYQRAIEDARKAQRETGVVDQRTERLWKRMHLLYEFSDVLDTLPTE